MDQGDQANKTVLSKEVEYLEERLKKAKISCQEYIEVVMTKPRTSWCVKGTRQSGLSQIMR